MSANRQLAPGVDTTLLNTHFSVVTDAVGVLRFPVKSKTFPPTVNIVRSFSSFSGFTSHTIFPYVNILSLGTWALTMKMTVFFPFTPRIPWANCPNSFAKDLSQIFLSGPFIRCLYSCATPEIWWVTEFYSRGVWPCAVNAYHGLWFLLPLDLKLELGPPISTLGGCTVFTLGDGIGTSGGIMCGPDGDLWTLCWKFVGLKPSSSSMTLSCGGGIYLVRPGCSVLGIPAYVLSACCFGGYVVLFLPSAALVNILDSCSIATECDSPMFENGTWGAVFCKA